VHDDVGAVGDGADQIRARHRVVHDQRDAGFVSDRGDRLDVQSVELRVADRLGVEQLGVGLDRAAEGLGVGGVDEVDVEAEARQGVDEEIVGAAVQAVGADDVIAGAGDVQDREGDGRRSRTEGERRHAALESCDALLEHVVRRVHDPRVDVAGLAQAEEVGGVVGAVERVGGGLVDGDGARVGRGIRRLAGVQGERLEPLLARLGLLAHLVSCLKSRLLQM
jgi:hypothetical protein